LTVFLNRPATNQIYICHRIGAGRTSRDVGVDRSFEMRRLISRFLSDESGATAIEYCLIAAGISIVIVVAVNGLGTTLNASFTSVNASIK
jgi:pilus assembly protein Flp/PilA